MVNLQFILNPEFFLRILYRQMVLLVSASCQVLTGFALPQVAPCQDYLRQAVQEAQVAYERQILPEYSFMKLHDGSPRHIDSSELAEELAVDSLAWTNTGGLRRLEELHDSESTVFAKFELFLPSMKQCKVSLRDCHLQLVAPPRFLDSVQRAQSLLEEHLPVPCLEAPMDGHGSVHEVCR